MPSRDRKPRVLVFVIAYYAESTLERVLERIPPRVLEEHDCEILVVDDASEDRTFGIGQEWKRTHPDVRITVLRNSLNQGYGGNQKVGYTYAIKRGFDVVVMLHGDGQYAPEELGAMIAPIARGEADAVFGSRMMTPFGALRGGMPLYKWLGNRILSTTQNLLLRTRLSEFHSGYRAYSVAALAKTKFLLSSDDFHFDTEIIIQLLEAKQRIVEIPIPTYYGDEICRVNGMKYAKDVVVATTKSVLHRSGLLYQRRFDPGDEGNEHYDLKLGYPSSHQWALEAVPPGAKVVDLGAGPGGMAQELVKRGCEVTVVDQYAPRREDSEDRSELESEVEVLVQDLDRPLAVDLGEHTHLLMLDVIEHLKSPETFLEDLRTQFTYEPKTIVITTPNIAFVIPRLMLLAGQFNYGKRGILDRTHTRLFTLRSLLQLLDDAGLKVKEVRGIPAPFPKALGDNAVARGALGANQLLIRLSRTLFSYQFFVVAESRPTIDFILGDTVRQSAKAEKTLEERRSAAAEDERAS
jgi:glycosyltransferase involved in cell wall biosynthesis